MSKHRTIRDGMASAFAALDSSKRTVSGDYIVSTLKGKLREKYPRNRIQASFSDHYEEDLDVWVGGLDYHFSRFFIEDELRETGSVDMLCRAIVEAIEYMRGELISPRRPMTCNQCGRPVVYDDEDYCVACLALRGVRDTNEKELK